PLPRVSLASSIDGSRTRRECVGVDIRALMAMLRADQSGESRPMPDIAFRTATELGAAIRKREIGAAELLEHYLARVERFNPPLNAIISTDLDGARRRAAAA